MIIAFTGLKGSGKSTACSMLKHLGYLELNFADPLKQMAVELAPDYITLEECYILEEKERPRFIEINANKLELQAYKYGYDHLPKSLYGHTHFEFKSLRHYLQWLGTEFGRELESEFWIKVFKTKIDPNKNYVCGDVRFDNEASTIRDLGGSVVMISRPTTTNTNIDTHASEQLNLTADYTIVNTDLELFKNDVLAIEGLIRYGALKS